jgi:hypothetical protein
MIGYLKVYLAAAVITFKKNGRNLEKLYAEQKQNILTERHKQIVTSSK